MFDDYYKMRDWIEEFIPLVYGKEELGLGRISELLKKLGNPERKFRSIHIAGTSGKGSTAFYISQLLRNCKLETRNSKLETNTNFQNPKSKSFSDFDIRDSDLKPMKIGLHVSPHLTYIGERMQINGNAIPARKLVDLIGEIVPTVESMKDSKVGLPSYFEILVAASFVYFAREKVDFVVVEVGLGGRLDATNVLVPEVSIITNIGLDHTEILGKTIEAIAGEKAGIIKVGVPTVTGASGKALRVIEKVARDKGSKLIKVTTQKGPLGNQVLARTALETLGIKVGEGSMKKVFEEGFEGRFEEIEEGPTSPKGLRGVNVILDGAHNPDKIRVLISWLKEKFPAKSVVLVLAFKKGKRWKKMVDLLIQNLPIEQIIATEFSAVTDTGKFAAVPAEEIVGYVKSKSILRSKTYPVKVESCQNSQEAVFYALSTKDSPLTLVTGSLYLVGEARTIWYLPEF